MTHFDWWLQKTVPVLYASGLTPASLFRTSDINPPPQPAIWRNILPTLVVLEDLAISMGVEIEITSAWRGPTYNAMVGGSMYSLHKKFNAIDFKVRRIGHGPEGMFNIEVVEPAEVVEYLEGLDIASQLGIGIYGTFTHLDTRKLLGRRAPARWTG